MKAPTLSRLFRWVSLLVLVAFLAACAGTPTAAPTQPPASSGGESGAPADLIAAAKQEGMLTTIALPHDWCNYGEAIETFKQKYGLQVNELNPDASSAEEIEAIKANKDSKGPQAPDVIDVGYAFGPQLVEEKLVMPYKVSTWDTIPDNLKHPDGYWYGDYYGVMAFEVNKDVVKNVPQDWADLLKPEYKNQVALAGDPRLSAQAQMSVYAAALANGGSLDNVQPGLEYFKKLNEVGNFVPVIAKQSTIAKGETPVVFRWDYNALADKKAWKATPRLKWLSPRAASSQAFISRRSARMLPIPTPLSCGWNSSTPTRVN